MLQNVRGPSETSSSPDTADASTAVGLGSSYVAASHAPKHPAAPSLRSQSASLFVVLPARFSQFTLAICPLLPGPHF